MFVQARANNLKRLLVLMSLNFSSLSEALNKSSVRHDINYFQAGLIFASKSWVQHSILIALRVDSYWAHELLQTYKPLVANLHRKLAWK